MKFYPSIYLFLLLFALNSLTNCAPVNTPVDSLYLFTDPDTGLFGYRNEKGETAIPAGKYAMCFTDTFNTYAIVLQPDAGFVGIDRKENVLYQVFPFDNGPDYPSEGLFRITLNGKIGFADAASGKVVIQPTFDCAFPFKNGLAKVSTDCSTQRDGDHSTWISDSWYYINAEGKRNGNASEQPQ